MRDFFQDLRFGLRLLRGSPGFTAVAVFTLALGIAATTTVFSWIDGLLLRPFPGSSDSHQLAVLEIIRPEAPNGANQISYVDYREYRKHLKSLSGLAVHREEVFSLGDAEHTQAVWGELVSGNYFQVLGVTPALGRVFTPEEDGDKPGAYPVAVISHGLWQRRFQADRGVEGKTLRVNRRALTIVGVAPPEFRGTLPGLVFDIWVPFTMGKELGMVDESAFRARGNTPWGLSALARLRPGVKIAEARAEAATFAHNLGSAFPKTNLGQSSTILPVWQRHSGAPELLLGPLRILMVISILLLLIVCANVANLLLARSVTRRREFSIRLALGAGGGRLGRQLLTETFLLAGAASLVGLALASWMGDSLPSLVPKVGVTVAFGFSLNGRILAFTILTCAAAALLAGVMPALLSEDQTLALQMVDQAGEDNLANKEVAAPWAPGVSLTLGRHLLQMIQHLDRHKSQLFYYLKLQGKPVNTADLWG